MDNDPSKKNDEAPGFFSRLLNTLIGIGLGESMLRAGTTLLSVILLVTVIWLLRLFYAQTPEAGGKRTRRKRDLLLPSRASRMSSHKARHHLAESRVWHRCILSSPPARAQK